MTNPELTMAMAPAALSVGGLVDYIKAVLEDDPTLRQVWVVGEVSSANPHAKGLFFTLTDPDTGAAINAVAWRSQQARLTTLPAVGEQVIALGTVKVYPQRSSYQLTVWQVLPSGDGLKALRYRQLRQRLAAEGLFDPEFKRPLPALPQTIAVVSSPQAAAWGDIQRSLRHHHPGLHVLFSPATVQGDNAPASIVAAIDRVASDGRAEVLILARGGGASEDLECFDDERVVRAIANCPIPVVTGIGHQRDESLADLAADLCAHTPTAAAIAAVPALADLIEAHHQRVALLKTLTAEHLLNAQSDVHRLGQRLLRTRLDQRVQQQIIHLKQLKRRLVQGVQVEMRQASDRTAALRSHLMTLDPDTVVKRGYALVRDEANQLVTQTSSVTPGQSLQVQLAQGYLTVQVTQIHPSAPLTLPSPSTPNSHA
ncbi:MULTISPECIES: exodeoxyribonuclease VII large subunit [Cyanophyceae]|uniref:exodeoxyribonuclease VII large subunit n=2 Tax=Cyanobacteriota TaxID=1117 RepID=UPI00168A1032|nr:MULTISPECIES: exodeoxyribonuclease VII large subunit [Cyanophyceae]MBD1919209.1 exodeoxyribonuclease VII large subunit [Phormidium sp. FACHB-77]MBD2033439.1 exodeoxyribonuclease VII large subunit [Phormidium sp. FACHB-322]MBD2054161.1 exodeoxyribonuclease VII large subunit [Leptolyngbya sp. FACHB-60]